MSCNYYLSHFDRFKTNDLVVLCYDEIISSYVVLTTEDTKYFLHPDSKSAMNLREGQLKPNWLYFVNHV